jgi:hypothetical protein
VSANTAAVVVGRLLEIRVEAGYRDIRDVDALFRDIGREMAKLPTGTRAVFVTDWRKCRLMNSEAADRVLGRIRVNNQRVERSAALAPQSSPLTMLQFMRLVRESENPQRRLFQDPETLIAWLDEVLIPSERARLREFLNAGTP